jgi:hypothetical protein
VQSDIKIGQSGLSYVEEFVDNTYAFILGVLYELNLKVFCL